MKDFIDIDIWKQQEVTGAAMVDFLIYDDIVENELGILDKGNIKTL